MLMINKPIANLRSKLIYDNRANIVTETPENKACVTPNKPDAVADTFDMPFITHFCK